MEGSRKGKREGHIVGDVVFQRAVRDVVTNEFDWSLMSVEDINN